MTSSNERTRNNNTFRRSLIELEPPHGMPWRMVSPLPHTVLTPTSSAPASYRLEFTVLNNDVMYLVILWYKLLDTQNCDNAIDWYGRYCLVLYFKVNFHILNIFSLKSPKYARPIFYIHQHCQIFNSLAGNSITILPNCHDCIIKRPRLGYCYCLLIGPPFQSHQSLSSNGAKEPDWCCMLYVMSAIWASQHFPQPFIPSICFLYANI